MPININLKDKIRLAILTKTLTPISKKDKELLEMMYELNNFNFIVELSSDYLKLLFLDRHKDDLPFYLKVEIIKSFKLDELKLEAIDVYKDTFDETSMVEIISSFESDELKLETIVVYKDVFHDYKKMKIISSFESDELKLEVIDLYKDDLSEDSLREVIKSVNSDKLKLEAIDLYKGKLDEYSKTKIIKTFESDELILKVLRNIYLESNSIRNIKEHLFLVKGVEYIKDNLYLFIEKELGLDNNDINDIEFIKDKLNAMEIRNSEVLKTVYFKFLNEKYINTLGQDKIDIIACYPLTQEKLLNLNEKEYNLLVKIVDYYDGDNKWQETLNEVLTNIESRTYKELIDNLSDNDIEENKHDIMDVIFKGINYFNVKNIDDIKNIDNLKDEVYELIKNNESLEKYPLIEELNVEKLYLKKFLIFQKVYGHDIITAEKLLGKYFDEIDLIRNEDTNNIVDYMYALNKILNTNDEELLDKMINDSELGRITINVKEIENDLKIQYTKSYNQELTQVDSLEKIEFENFEDYDVRYTGTDFNIMITSVLAYSANVSDNFYVDWNRNTLDSQGFCCSYIRNDMLGTAPIPNFCYGFNSMSEDSLLVSGPKDIFSLSNNLNTYTLNNFEKYYLPESQINNTINFNEMVYQRFQNDERKQPDYIMVFLENGKINDKVQSKIKKAVNEYRETGIELPIVLIDKDECERSERAKIDSMIDEYRNRNDEELLLKIKQKIRNNAQGNLSFLIYNEIIESLGKPKQELPKVQKDNYLEIHRVVPPKEREKNKQMILRLIEGSRRKDKIIEDEIYKD